MLSERGKCHFREPSFKTFSGAEEMPPHPHTNAQTRCLTKVYKFLDPPLSTLEIYVTVVIATDITLYLLTVLDTLNGIQFIILVSFFLEIFIGRFWRWNLHFFTFQETVGSHVEQYRKRNNINSVFGIPISCIKFSFFPEINLSSFNISSINLVKTYWSATIKFELAYPKNELGMGDYIERSKLAVLLHWKILIFL